METEKLDCGCEKELINGKFIWIYCDEHDVDSYEAGERPLTKFRKHYDY